MRAPRSLAFCLGLALPSLAWSGCGGAALLAYAITGKSPTILVHRPDPGTASRSIESASLDCVGVTDLSEQARALADELVLHGDGAGPEILGLHRIAGFGVGTSRDSLELILAALEARGLRYELVRVEGEAGDETGGRAGTESLDESEALLVRSDVIWRNAAGGPIEGAIPAADSGRVSFWVGCDLLLGDAPVRVVSSGPVGDAEAEITVTPLPSV